MEMPEMPAQAEAPATAKAPQIPQVAHAPVNGTGGTGCAPAGSGDDIPPLPAGGEIVLRQTGRWLEADVDTPISLFLGMVGSGQGILLESAEVDGRWGRFSVIAFNFLLRLGCRDGRLEVAVRDPRLAPLRNSTAWASSRAPAR